jgi:hypothetical protein
VARVDPRVYALAAFGILLSYGESFQLGVQFLEDGLWKAVGEMKGDVLGYVGAFKVEKVAAAVPPGSAILLNGVLRSAIHTANREIGVPDYLPGGVLRVGH